jgi:hypothetical protein
VRRRTARDPLPQGFRSLRSETQGERHRDAGSLEALRPGLGVVTPPMPRPRGVPLRSTSSRTAAATGVATIPLARFLPRRPPVKWVVSGRRPRVCTVRDQRICERSAAPVGFSCTDETPLAPPGAFIRTTPARRAEPEVVRAPEGVDRSWRVAPSDSLRSPGFQGAIASASLLGFSDRPAR